MTAEPLERFSEKPVDKSYTVDWFQSIVSTVRLLCVEI